MKRTAAIVFFATIAVGAALLVSQAALYVKDWIDEDACLDSGYVYDYARETCDHGASHLPYVPYSERHPGATWIVLSSMGACLISLKSLRFLRTK